jgi:hypothetical protein
MPMSKVESIENQIKELSAGELTLLRKWFADFDSELWDFKIDSDAKSGKLDRLAEAALHEHATGRSTKL